ncbi:MAG: DEAD/DEAH box helicase [Candidatus Poribacteria bacterium]
MRVRDFIREIKNSRDYNGQIVHIQDIPKREAIYGRLEKPLKPEIRSALKSQGIEDLYSHQVSAISAIRQGKNIVIVTSTASGKTLCYNIPVLEAILEDKKTRALYLYPTKALAQDQLKKLIKFKEINPEFNFETGTYDGDTPTNTRKKLRDNGRIILTNPDMLHASILPNHSKWASFFENLKYIVIDEIHTYKGIFGSNVANLMKRLNRICKHYGSSPQFICCSATISNPKELAESITNHRIVLIDNDGSPKGSKKFVLWNPPFLDKGMTERKSSTSEAIRIITELIRERVQTIAFAQSRVITELLYLYCQESLQRISPSLANSIRAYRGGYLPEDRREIERLLFSGELLGVISTNALELGIDIGGLDACILVGYPGSISSTWQRAGRAGRSKDDSLVILIGQNNPIDQYLMKHTKYFFEQPVENVVISVDNPHIMFGHLRCAVHELPMTIEDEQIFGESAPAILDLLQEDNQVRFIGGKWYWTGKGYPARDFGLRNMAENNYNIVDTTDNRNEVIGMLDEFSAFMLVHDQAIYLQEGETYFVKNLDIKQKIAYVEKVDADYYTQSITEDKIKIDEKEMEKEVFNSKAYFGQVTVTSITIMFRKIKLGSNDSIGFGNLSLPPMELETNALWITPPAFALARVKEYGRVPSEGLMGIGNALVGVIPLYVICDYIDIGPVVDSSNTGFPTIFIYDKYPGGLGFAEKSYELLDQILESCLELISSCPCDNGCPSCVGSVSRTWSYFDADSELKERIPDKEAALMLLHDMLGKEPYIPKQIALSQTLTNIQQLDVLENQPISRQIKPLPENVEAKIRKRIQSLKRKNS